MSTPVTLSLVSDDPSPVAIPGATVQIYLANSLTIVTTGTTDSDGEAAFSLPDASYDVRFYLLGMSILPKQPQRIVVDHSLGNVFTVTGHLSVLAESTNPALCRITGTMLGPDGSPVAEAKISFVPTSEIIVIGQRPLIPQMSIHFYSDENGLFDFTLLRGVNYKGYITLVDQIDLQCPLELDIRVPSMAGLDLGDLLFPLPVSAVFSSPTVDVDLHGDPDVSITCTITYSDYSVRTTPPPWVAFFMTHTDATIDGTVLLGEVVCITPVKAGVDTISMTRTIHAGTLFLPAPADFTAGSLEITVA